MAKAFEASGSAWAPDEAVDSRRRSLLADWRPFIGPLLTFAGYYVGSQIGFALTFRPNPVSVLWPPNAILLAALLLTPVRQWGMILLGAFPAHCAVQLQTNIPVTMMLCYFISNSCEALIGASMIRYFTGGPVRFDSLRNTGIFCVCAGLLAPFVSSFVDAGFVRLNDWGTGGYWELWRIRFFSNVLAALTFAPPIISWLTRRTTRPRGWDRRRAIEATLLFAGLGITLYATFYKAAPGSNPVVFLAPLPFVLWAALRLGPRGTTTAVVTITFLAIWSAGRGHGPFTGQSPQENARAVQMFLIVIAVPFLFLAAGIEERGLAEERFTNAFRCSPDAMWIARLRDGTVLDVNDQWEKLFGHRRQDAIGRTVRDLNLWSELADREELVRRIRSSPVRDFEVSLQNSAGGLVPVLLSADMVEINGEASLVIIVRDITDRKRAEQADRNLAQTSRLTLLGELTASIAHEINQPLGAILANAETAEMLLESDSPPIDELRRIITDIRNDDIRASETIGHIRLLMQKRRPQSQPVDIHELINHVLGLVASEARRRHVLLETALTAHQHVVSGDRVQLQQMMMNVIMNGMESMSETAQTNRNLVVRSVERRPDRIEITVSDLGHGIPQDKVTSLFDSFFTTKEGGLGLGLAIVRSIADAHDGVVSAENNRGGGATFRIILPSIQDDAPAVE